MTSHIVLFFTSVKAFRLLTNQWILFLNGGGGIEKGSSEKKVRLKRSFIKTGGHDPPEKQNIEVKGYCPKGFLKLAKIKIGGNRYHGDVVTT